MKRMTLIKNMGINGDRTGNDAKGYMAEVKGVMKKGTFGYAVILEIPFGSYEKASVAAVDLMDCLVHEKK